MTDGGAEPVFQVFAGDDSAQRHLDPSPPPDATGGARWCDAWPGEGDAGDAATLRVARAILAHVRDRRRRLLLLLTGPLDAQARFGREVLDRRALRARVHLALCVGEVTHPLPAPARDLFGRADAVVTTTVQARDTVARHLADAGVAPGPELCQIDHGFPLRALAGRGQMHGHRTELGIEAGDLVIAAPFRRASQWSALAFQIFKVWSEGLHRDCRRCRARMMPALRVDKALLEPVSACPHCGARDLEPGVRRPRAVLVQHELCARPGTPDPDVLGEWLGRTNARMLRGDDVPGPPAAPAWSRVLALADVALVPADNAYANPLVAASLACATPCVTTGSGGVGGPGVETMRTRSYGWDLRNHLVAYPDPVAATRTLDALADDPARLPALRAHAAARRPELDEARTGCGWRRFVEAQLARPRIAPRTPLARPRRR